MYAVGVAVVIAVAAVAWVHVSNKDSREDPLAGDVLASAASCTVVSSFEAFHGQGRT